MTNKNIFQFLRQYFMNVRTIFCKRDAFLIIENVFPLTFEILLTCLQEQFPCKITIFFHFVENITKSSKDKLIICFLPLSMQFTFSNIFTNITKLYLMTKHTYYRMKKMTAQVSNYFLHSKCFWNPLSCFLCLAC